jgi:hypothetical protein
MRTVTADTLRGSGACVAIGVASVLLPPAQLPRGFGYYAAGALFLLGLRFGARAIGMFLAACAAIAVAVFAGRGGCTPSSDHLRCSLDAATPLLVFGYFVVPLLAGALLGGAGRLSAFVARATRGDAGPRLGFDRDTLAVGHTVAVALASASVAFVAVALLPLSGPQLFLPSLAACAALGLAPSYREAPARVQRPQAPPTW